MSSVADEGRDVYLTFFPLYSVGSIYIGALWLALVYKLFIKNQYEFGSDSSYCFYRVTALICFSGCLGTAILDTTHLYLCYLYNYYMLSVKLNIVKAVADFLYFIASLSLNIILFGRVYYTFQLSYFALSKCTIFCICIQIVSSAAIDLAYCVVVFFCGSDEEKADGFIKPLVIALIVNDLLISISMLYVFSYKLKEIIIMTNTLTHCVYQSQKEKFRKFKEISSVNIKFDSYDRKPEKSLLSSDKITCTINDGPRTISISRPSSMVAQRNSDTVHLDAIQLDTLVVVTRHTILSGFAIFFNQLYYGFNYISMRKEWENSYRFGILVYGLRMIGMIGVTTSLYFSMKFAKESYFKCCACCHLTCYKCCVRCTKTTISQKRKMLSQKREQI